MAVTGEILLKRILLLAENGTHILKDASQTLLESYYARLKYETLAFLKKAGACPGKNGHPAHKRIDKKPNTAIFAALISFVDFITRRNGLPPDES